MFSIVVPVFNKRATLARTVASALGQSFRGFELILVDDGSTDGSLEAVAGIDDSRLRVLRQVNAGPGPARNTGAAAARHDWIAFLDADDLWLDDHLAELDRIRRAVPGAGLIGTAYSYASLDEAPAIGPRRGGEIRQIAYFDAIGRGEEVLRTSSAAIPKAVWRETGGFAPFPSGEDSELWVRIAWQWPVAVSNRTTAIYLMQTGGISDVRRSRRLGAPPQGLDDLSPAVATALRLKPSAASAELRRAVDRFVARYVHWYLLEAVNAGDVASIRALARLAPPGLSLKDRLLLLAGRLPAGFAWRLYGSALRARKRISPRVRA